MKELETKRLRLRRLRASDAEAIYHGWASDPEVTRYLTWNPHRDIHLTRAILSGWLEAYNEPDCLRYGIERKEDGVLMGMVDVVEIRDGVPVIGYCLGRAHWNRGYMTEAMQAVIQELFCMGCPAIAIEAVRENAGSNRVIEKCGFTLVETRQQPMSRLKPEIVTLNAYLLSP